MVQVGPAPPVITGVLPEGESSLTWSESCEARGERRGVTSPALEVGMGCGIREGEKAGRDREVDVSLSLQKEHGSLTPRLEPALDFRTTELEGDERALFSAAASGVVR